TASLVRFPSMVSNADNNLLTSIKAVSPGYPLRGKLKLASHPDEEAAFQATRVADNIPGPGTGWIDEKGMSGLQVDPGDQIEVGALEMTITALVASEPDHSVGFVSMNPRLLMNEEDLVASELIQPGSRVSYQLLVAGNEKRVAEFRSWVEA